MNTNTSTTGMRKIALVAFPLLLALPLLLATKSTAATVTINDVNLFANNRTWYPDSADGACIPIIKSGYSPANDASLGIQSDAFDGGLLLVSGNDPFNPKIMPSGPTADLTGNQLTVGPKSFAGFKVTRFDRLLSSGIMRSLIKLENKKKKAVSSHLALDTGLGSDSYTGVRKASNGSKMNKSSRWVVTSDSATNPSDPVVTMAFFGKGKPKVKVRNLPLGPPRPSSDCITVSFGKVKIPARTTGYLLFFADINTDNETGISAAKKFNKKKLNSQLLAGISKGVKKKVLNWDF